MTETNIPETNIPETGIPETGIPETGIPDRDIRRRRLLFRATHRGTHETDLLVGGYVADRLASLSDAEMTALEAVMELPDTDLADWLTGRLKLPAQHDTPLLRAMRDAALTRKRDPESDPDRHR